MTKIKLAELIKKAEAYEDAGEFALAVEVYDQLCKAYPDSPVYRAFRGYAFFCQGEYSKAHDDFDSALVLKPNSATTLFYRAQTKERLNDVIGALEDYEASASISPEADVYVNIALIQRFRKQFKESREAIGKALELDPENEIAQRLLNDWEDRS